MECPFQTSHLTRTQFAVDEHQSVVEAPALNQVEVQQRQDFVQEYESAAGGDACGILGQVVHVGRLAADDAVGEIDGALHREGLGRSDVEHRAGGLVFEMDGLGKAERFPIGIKFTRPHACQLQQPRTRRAVEDGHLAAVQLDQGVVNLTAVQGRHQMFDGGDAVAAASDGGSAGRLGDVGRKGRLGEDIEAVGATEGDTEVRRRGAHGDRHGTARMEAEAGKAELFLDGGLFHWTGVKWKSVIRYRRADWFSKPQSTRVWENVIGLSIPCGAAMAGFLKKSVPLACSPVTK